jgi:hypothetical protein
MPMPKNGHSNVLQWGERERGKSGQGRVRTDGVQSEACLRSQNRESKTKWEKTKNKPRPHQHRPKRMILAHKPSFSRTAMRARSDTKESRMPGKVKKRGEGSLGRLVCWCARPKQACGRLVVLAREARHTTTGQYVLVITAPRRSTSTAKTASKVQDCTVVRVRFEYVPHPSRPQRPAMPDTLTQTTPNTSG